MYSHFACHAHFDGINREIVKYHATPLDISPVKNGDRTIARTWIAEYSSKREINSERAVGVFARKKDIHPLLVPSVNKINLR